MQCPYPRKQKRHGKLAAAGRNLIFEAQKGQKDRPRCWPPTDNASSIAKADAINLAAKIAERADWRQAAEVRNELKKIWQEPLAKSS
jgi:hypothetical protein